jgi:hypothetical protein
MNISFFEWLESVEIRRPSVKEVLAVVVEDKAMLRALARWSECLGQLEVVPLKSVQNKRPCLGL